MTNVLDLSHLRKPEAQAEPEPAEQVVVKTFRIPRTLQPAQRQALAIVDLGLRGQAAMSVHAEGACLFLEVPGEDVRVMPREALLEGWLPPVAAAAATQTDRMPPITLDGDDLGEDHPVDPVSQRLEADRTAFNADEAPLHERLHAERSADREADIGIDEVDGAAAGFVGVGTGPFGHAEALTVGVSRDGLAHLTATFGEHHCSVALPWKAIVDMVRKVTDLRAELDALTGDQTDG